MQVYEEGGHNILIFFITISAESVTEQILEKDFKKVALGVKRQRVEEGLEDVPADISDVALKVLLKT